MIIWIASYPRSGNTLVRKILWECFGQNTHSKYNDKFDLGSKSEISDLIGHLDHGDSWPDFYERARIATQPVFIKTHEPENDDEKMIFVVRDGRSAMVSYFHYYRDVLKKEVSMLDILCGNTPFGSWSDLAESCGFGRRPNTLTLRFEDLILNPEVEIKKILKFTGLKKVLDYENDFSRLNNVFSGFFRSGSNEKNLLELSEGELALFGLLHGETALKLGYDTPADSQIEYIRPELMNLVNWFKEKSRLQTFKNRTIDLEKKISKKNKELSHCENILQKKQEKRSEFEEKIRDLEAKISKKNKALSHYENLLQKRENLIKEQQLKIDQFFEGK